MDAVKKALRELSFRVPPQILKIVFSSGRRSWGRQQGTISIEEQIMALVIRPRVMVDTEIASSILTNIPIDKCDQVRVDRNTWTVTVPKSLTDGRSILSVQEIQYASYNATTVNPPALQMRSSVYSNAERLLAANEVPPIASNHRVDIVGENVVLISEVPVLMPNLMLSCLLGTDENLSHLKPKYYNDFARLVEYAVKSYIYNQYVIELDYGEIEGGQAIGRVKEIIESYSDMEELYQTYLEEQWFAKEIANDEASMSRYIAAMISTH